MKKPQAVLGNCLESIKNDVTQIWAFSDPPFPLSYYYGLSFIVTKRLTPSMGDVIYENGLKNEIAFCSNIRLDYKIFILRTRVVLKRCTS